MSLDEARADEDSPVGSDDDAAADSHVVSLGACLLLSGVYLFLALDLPLGDTSRPGGGFFPVVVGVLGVVASAAALSLEWRRRHDARLRRGQISDGWLRRTVQAATFVVVMASYIVIAPWIGHTLASVLVLMALLRLTRARPWWQILLFAVVFSVAVTLLFETVLGMRLPTGRVINVL